MSDNEIERSKSSATDPTDSAETRSRSKFLDELGDSFKKESSELSDKNDLSKFRTFSNSPVLLPELAIDQQKGKEVSAEFEQSGKPELNKEVNSIDELLKIIKNGDARVIAWGDVHPQHDGKKTFVDFLAGLKASRERGEDVGVTDVGVEGFPHTKEAQDKIDEYFKLKDPKTDDDKNRAESLRKELADMLRNTPGVGKPVSETFIEDMMAVVDAIKDAGLHMFGLEPGDDKHNRDESWKEAVEESLHDGNKVLIFGGMMHHFKESPPGQNVAG